MTDPDDPPEHSAPDPVAEASDDALALARDIANAYRGKTAPSRPGARRRRGPAGPARTARDEPSPVADLLGQVVREQGWEDQLAATRVFTDWPRIVGPEVAQHSEVTAFDDGVVDIRATSTAWATELKFLAPRIVAKLNAELGDGSVLRIQISGPRAPSWRKGPRSIRGARGPRDTYG